MTEEEVKGFPKGSLLTGRTLERHFELHQALMEFSRLFDYEEENDRAIAVVGVTFLEMLLEHSLIAFFVDDEKEVQRLLSYDQPLGAFGSRITLCYCLGLIPKPIRDDLRLAGKIRNRFAHNLAASFEEEKIRSWCESLQWHRIAYIPPHPEATTRDLFQVGVNQLVTYLNAVPSIARGQRREPPRC